MAVNFANMGDIRNPNARNTGVNGNRAPAPGQGPTFQAPAPGANQARVGAMLNTQSGGAAGTAPGTTPGGAPLTGGSPDINSFYNDMLKRQDANWQSQQGLLNNQMAAGQRGAAELNARMGRSIGGGYSQLQGQAQAQGMNEMQKAWLAYQDQRNGTQQNWLNAKTTEMQRQEDWQHHLDDRNFQANQMAALNQGGTPSAGATGTHPDPGTYAQGQGLGYGGGNPNGWGGQQNIAQAASMRDAFSLSGIDPNSSTGQQARAEMENYTKTVWAKTGKFPSAGELRDRLRDVGLLK